MSHLALRLVLGGMSLAGMWAALTMTGAFYGWWRGPTFLVPERLCSTKVGGCLDILATRYARLFGPPNSSLGLAYYVVLAALAILGPASLAPVERAILLTMAWGVVAFSAYLAWSLLFKLKTVCVLCFFSQVLNLAIAILLTLGLPG